MKTASVVAAKNDFTFIVSSSFKFYTPFALSHFFIAASEDAQEEPVIASPRATVAAGQSFLISLSLRPIPQRQKCTSLYIFALRVLPYVKTSCLLGTSGIHAASENVYPYTELHIS